MHGQKNPVTMMRGLPLTDPLQKRVDLTIAAITVIELVILLEIVAQSAKIVAHHLGHDLLAAATEMIADLFHHVIAGTDVDLLAEAVATVGISTAVGLDLQEIGGAVKIVEARHQDAVNQAGAVRRTGVVSRVDN